jgi:cyclopropane fatty-acyl-phospholipid synthase-like methyltransferase
VPESPRVVYSRDFWAEENTKYARPHLRMRKVARLVNRLAAGREVALLDVGCGPATLELLLAPNVRYHGIDIAIQEPAPNLKQSDVLAEPISSDAAPFDLIVAEGLFEYLADKQSQKFAEIADLLTPSGRFIVTYVNFDHRRPNYYWPYSNIQSSGRFRAALAEHFVIERQIPTAHNWNHSEPGRWYVRGSNMYLNIRMPFFSSWLGVEYLYVCRPRIRGN